MFFDPQVHLANGVPLSTVILSIKVAQIRAERDLGVSSLLTPCLLRHLPVADAEAAFERMADAGYFADGTLAALGLCSTEIARPPAAWAPVFARARELGVRRTVHAGEEGPAAYVAAALDDLGAMRIDHGVNSRGDLAVVERLAREGVMLTVCPLSNVRLKGVSAMTEVPIRLFLDKGVKFSINSDDPAYFGGYILDNYCAVQEAFGLSVDEWAGIAMAALEGSWCDEERKGEIKKDIDTVFRRWRRRERRASKELAGESLQREETEESVEKPTDSKD
jgi:adenosine deaminase